MGRMCCSLVTALVVAGCALLPEQVPLLSQPSSATQVRDACQREHDSFRKETVLRGPVWRDGRDASFSLSSGVGEAARDYLELEIELLGDEWRFISSAIDGDGRQLVCETVERSIDGARVEERIVVRLPSAVVTEPTGRDLSLRLYGSRANYDLVVPEFYVRGFAYALER